MRGIWIAAAAIWLALAPGAAGAAEQVWPATGGGGMRLGYTPLHFPPSYNADWSVDLTGSYIGDSTPAVDQYHRMYVATNDDTPRVTQSFLYCVGSDGSLIWKTPIGARLEFQPVLLASGTVLAISVQKQLFAFRSDGTALWNVQLTAAPAATNTDFTHNYSSFARLPSHAQPVPDSAGGFYVIDDTPAVVSFDGRGARRWSTTFINAATSGLTMGDGTLYFATSDGWLHVLAALTGRDLGPVALNGTAATVGTYMPGSLLYYPVLSAGGPHLMAYSIAGTQPFDYLLTLNPSAPVAVDAQSDAVVSIGAAGSQDNTVMTDGQLIGLNKAGNAVWRRDFSAVPTNVLADSGGLICFGTQAAGQMGVYCFHPDRGVQWWTLTDGATSVFPVDDYLLGVTVSYPSSANRTKLLTIGGK
jgi:outer membrane protein assembly factor BamB